MVTPNPFSPFSQTAQSCGIGTSSSGGRHQPVNKAWGTMGGGPMALGRMVRTASAMAGAVGLAVLAVLVLPSTAAYAATINVTPGHSIQAAVDAAQPGDTVHVA